MDKKVCCHSSKSSKGFTMIIIMIIMYILHFRTLRFFIYSKTNKQIDKLKMA